MSGNAIALELIPAPNDPEMGRTIPIPMHRLLGGRSTFALRRRASGLQIKAGPMAGPVELLTMAAPALIAAAGVAAGAWLQGRANRKVKLKVGDVEGEARTMEELRQLLIMARDFREKPADPPSP